MMKRILSILLLMSVALAVGCSKTEESTASNLADSSNVTSTEETSSIESVAEVTREYSAEDIKCDPIDKSLDCEQILFEKSDRLQTLIMDYLNNDENKLAYSYGEGYTDENGTLIGAEIISDEMSSYADFKALFSDCIYGDYFDYINSHAMSTLFEIDGVLYGRNGQSALLGTDETWYLGYDVQDDRIIGHFAELMGLGEPSENTAEYLNDESNYRFYDITVQCVNGEYVITDCHELSDGKRYDYSDVHGLFYNSGFADISLITNEKVMPEISAPHGVPYWLSEDGSEYDDDNVPAEWLPICTAAEALRRFDDIAGAETSGDDVVQLIRNLANKNVLLFETKLCHTFDIDRSESYPTDNSEAEFHPIRSQYFADLDSIKSLVYGTYKSDVADKYLFGENMNQQLFIENNGQMYVDTNALMIWSMDPFIARSYIEITEMSDDSCVFIWHYPDVEWLNAPDKYKYFYYDKEYTASLSNGSWVLNDMVFNNR